MKDRFFFTIMLFCLIPLLPWWLVFFSLIVGVIFIRNYFEGLMIAFIFDLAYGLPSGWLGTQFTFTVLLGVLYLLVEGLRDSFTIGKEGFWGT